MQGKCDLQVSRELALDSLVRDTKMRFVISVPAEASRAREQEGAAHRAAAAERGGDKGGWDGSTRAGDSAVARMEAADKRREADDFLRENPELR